MENPHCFLMGISTLNNLQKDDSNGLNVIDQDHLTDWLVALGTGADTNGLLHKVAEITAAITYNGTPGISVNHFSHEGQTLEIILYQVSLDKREEKGDNHYCGMEAQCLPHFKVPPLKNKDISKDRKLKYFKFCARGEPCTAMRTKVQA